jgi:hypothetical protein
MRQQVSWLNIDKYLQPLFTSVQPGNLNSTSPSKQAITFSLPYFVEIRKHDAPYYQQDIPSYI